MTFVRSLIFATICLAGTLSVASAQTTLDLSAPVIALESLPQHGVIEGQALPRGIQDNTALAAPFVIEKCLEHVEGVKSLEQSFAGTRFARVENPLLAYIPGTSPVAYAHFDLYETFLYDQSSGDLTGCGITMAGPNATIGFDKVRAFFTSRYGITPDADDMLLGEQVKLGDIGETGVISNFGFAEARMRVLVTPVNDKTGFIMSIFLQKAEG